MAANAKLMEAILVLQHKVDLLLKLDQIRHMRDGTKGLADLVALAPVGDPNHYCPVCDQKVDYTIDINDAVVIRKCKCSTGKIALDMGAFAPPVTPARKKDEDGGTDQEDRRDSDRRSRGTGRR